MDHHLCQFFSLVFAITFFTITHPSAADGIGVNYGQLGNNLPTPSKVIQLLQSRNIKKVRIFDPNPDILTALGGSGIEAVVGTLNQDLQQLCADIYYAMAWVNKNVVAHPNVQFRYIVAGNEVIPSDLANFVLGAMQNLELALESANLRIPVTTAISLQPLTNTYPPSQATFSAATLPIITPIVTYLTQRQYPLLINVYPYFAYASDLVHVREDYALFTATTPVFTDGGLPYYNLFDAMLDAMYSAVEKVGGGDTTIVVSESGWPSAGNGDLTTVQKAQTYVNNLVGYLAKELGSPKRPKAAIEGYVFAIFNENQKPAGVEQNFGLYQPDMTEVYHVNFP